MIDDNEHDDSNRDESSQCDMKSSAFFRENNTMNEVDEVEEVLHEGAETNFMSTDFKWETWVPFSDDDKIDSPEEVDHYNGVHGLRPSVANKLSNILQCIFSTREMDINLF